jgi:hypothetical protein
VTFCTIAGSPYALHEDEIGIANKLSEIASTSASAFAPQVGRRLHDEANVDDLLLYAADIMHRVGERIIRCDNPL